MAIETPIIQITGLWFDAINLIIISYEKLLIYNYDTILVNEPTFQLTLKNTKSNYF